MGGEGAGVKTEIALCKLFLESISQMDWPQSKSSQEARVHLMYDPSYFCTSPDGLFHSLSSGNRS